MIWSTPQPMFDALYRRFKFKVDLCADPDNAKLPRYYLRSDSLNMKWNESGFLNPPFGKEVGIWLAKAREDANEYGVIHVCVVPGRTNAPWWHDTVMKAGYLLFVRKKVSFMEPGGKKGVPPWGVVIAVFHNGTEPVKGGPLCESWDYR